MNNGLAWLVTLLSPADSELGGSNLQTPGLLPWPVVLLSLLAVIAAAAWLRRAVRTS